MIVGEICRPLRCISLKSILPRLLLFAPTQTSLIIISNKGRLIAQEEIEAAGQHCQAARAPRQRPRGSARWGAGAQLWVCSATGSVVRPRATPLLPPPRRRPAAIGAARDGGTLAPSGGSAAQPSRWCGRAPRRRRGRHPPLPPRFGAAATARDGGEQAPSGGSAAQLGRRCGRAPAKMDGL